MQLKFHLNIGSLTPDIVVSSANFMTQINSLTLKVTLLRRADKLIEDGEDFIPQKDGRTIPSNTPRCARSCWWQNTTGTRHQLKEHTDPKPRGQRSHMTADKGFNQQETETIPQIDFYKELVTFCFGCKNSESTCFARWAELWFRLRVLGSAANLSWWLWTVYSLHGGLFPNKSGPNSHSPQKHSTDGCHLHLELMITHWLRIRNTFLVQEVQE